MNFSIFFSQNLCYDEFVSQTGCQNKSCENKLKLYIGDTHHEKRVLLSVAAATALTLGVSSLDAQAATVQPSNIKVQNIQHSKVMMKQMSQQELQAFLQSMGVESLAQWQQGNFQPNCIIPGQQPTENVVTEQPTAKPETQKPAEQNLPSKSLLKKFKTRSSKAC